MKITDEVMQKALDAYRTTSKYPIVPGNHYESIKAALEAAFDSDQGETENRAQKDLIDRARKAFGFALRQIADESEIHTKLNQERLCCKFQHIAIMALKHDDAIV